MTDADTARNGWQGLCLTRRPLGVGLFLILMLALTGDVVADGYDKWEPGGNIPLAVEVGTLGATDTYEATPAGVADVFGNGPYDLILTDHKVLPFRRMSSEGVPVYGPPQTFKLPSRAAALFTDESSALCALYPSGQAAYISKFDASTRKFTAGQKSDVAWPKNARSFAATLSPRGRLLVYFSVPDGRPYYPTDVHSHLPGYRPFNGSGIWRGGRPFSSLGAAMFIDGTGFGKSMVKHPVYDGGRDFQFSNPGITVVNLGKGHERDIVASDKLGTFHFFHNRASDAINLDEGVFVSDERGNALRHPGINPKPVAIADPETGYSNLIVGDTGIVWFYRFTGRFNQIGGPIYEKPKRVLVEDPPLVLSALPVITSGDLDNDGLIDLLAGNDVGDFYFARNIGTEAEPGFDVPHLIKAGGETLKVNAGYGCIQGPGEARWGYTCPTLYDWNGDGLLDIIYNSIHGDITVLLHKPDTSPPAFEKPVVLKCDSLELRLVWRTQPAVTDWGKEGGGSCIIVNDENNQLRRFWRIDDYNVRRGELLKLATGEPIQAHGKRHGGQYGRTKLQAVDWDRDGKVDLIAGTGRAASIPGPGGYPDDTFKGDSRQATVLFLRNVGTNDNPVFEYPCVMHYKGKKIAMGTHSCTPLAVDLGRGELDLLVGMEDGVVSYFPRESLTWPDIRASAE